MRELVFGPQLQHEDRFLASTEHRMAPFPDHVLIREPYQKLFEQLEERRLRGMRGAVILATPGMGMKPLVLFLAKRPPSPCSDWVEGIELPMALMYCACSDSLGNASWGSHGSA
jgi:hypothetical protein